MLFEYDWPGNVRELRAAIRNAAAFAEKDAISLFHLKEATLRRPKQKKRGLALTNCGVSFDPNNDAWRDVIKRVQVIYFRALLETTRGNKEKAISMSGLGRTQFYEKLKEIELMSGNSSETREENSD